MRERRVRTGPEHHQDPPQLSHHLQQQWVRGRLSSSSRRNSAVYFQTDHQKVLQATRASRLRPTRYQRKVMRPTTSRWEWLLTQGQPPTPHLATAMHRTERLGVLRSTAARTRQCPSEDPAVCISHTQDMGIQAWQRIPLHSLDLEVLRITAYHRPNN